MRKTGYDTLGEYSFGKKLCTHKFCKTCGSSILIDFNGAFAGGKDAGTDIEPSKDTIATNVSVLFTFEGFADVQLLGAEYGNRSDFSRISISAN